MNKNLLAVIVTVAALLGVTVQAEAACPKPPQILPNVTVVNDDQTAVKVKFIQHLFPTAPVAFIEFALEYCGGDLFETCLFIDMTI